MPNVQLTSTATTITVTSAATALSSAAASLTQSNAFLAFKGLKSGTSTVGSIDFNVNHPTSGAECDVTEDGNGANHTSIDWASQGIYDPVRKRVMWLGSGAGGQITGGCVYNVLATYDEATDTWSAVRGLRGTNTTTGEPTIAHQYGGNCFHPVDRKLYKKHFSGMSFYEYNLDTDAIGLKRRYTSSNNNSEAANGDGAFDYVTSRGRVWVRSLRNADYLPAVWEFNTEMTATTLIYGGGTLGGSYSSNNKSPLSFNPRAFGGVGGVFVGTPSAWTIETNASLTLRANTTGMPSSTSGFDWPNGGHLVRDPVGDGWLYAHRDGHMWRLSSNGTWEQRAQLPLALRNQFPAFNVILIPIDEYGVVWIIANNIGAERAWLYRP